MLLEKENAFLVKNDLDFYNSKSFRTNPTNEGRKSIDKFTN